MNNPLSSSIASEFHPTKNGDLKVSELTAGSSKKVWWLGQNCGHEWQASPHARTQGIGCAICGGRQILAGFNDLATTHPYLASEWHPTKNGTLLATQVSAGMPRKAWWQDKFGHEWETAIGGRKQGRNCPICGGRKVLTGFNDLATVNPTLASEFHPTKNGQLTAKDITGQTTKLIWWLCKQGHEWQATLNHRNRKSGIMGCGVCAGQKVLAGFNDFATTHPDLAKAWHPTKNGTLIPQNFRPGSDKKVWWQDKLGHEWEATLNARTSKAGSGCPFCSGHKSLAGISDLATVNPELASEWHPTKNGTLTPSMVSAGTAKKAWWICAKGHEWEAGIYSRASGRGCAQCAFNSYSSKAEKSIQKFLEDLGLFIEMRNRSVLKGKEIDIYLPEQGIGIEFNGLYYHNDKVGKGEFYHYNKWATAQAKGIKLIQIWEDDWNKDRVAVLNYLESICNRNIKKYKKIESIPTIISSEEATIYLNTHTQPFGTLNSDLYVGLKNPQGELFELLGLSLPIDGVATITLYSQENLVENSFNTMLDSAIKEFNLNKVLAITDNCRSGDEIYFRNGFTATDTLPPSYSLLVKGKRILSTTDTSKKENSSSIQLPRIWDAGKTRWVKENRA